eukprot:15373290-Alexandrium_andersonii.AAC.1
MGRFSLLERRRPELCLSHPVLRLGALLSGPGVQRPRCGRGAAPRFSCSGASRKIGRPPRDNN